MSTARKLNPEAESLLQATMDLRPYIGGEQWACINQGMRGEEREYFVELLHRLANTVRTMPKVYEQDGLGDQAVVHLHYFKGSMDFWITERDISRAQHQAFGLAKIHESELGYISIVDLIRNNVELDFHWTPKTLAEVWRTTL